MAYNRHKPIDATISSAIEHKDDNYTEHETSLDLCWLMPTCSTCLSSRYSCGWCGSTHACVALPQNYTFPLLHPVFHPASPEAICPSSDDRWEFRTRTLGCHVSSLTVVACVVTVLCTLLALAVLVEVCRILRAVFSALGVFWTRAGWQVWVDGQGRRHQGGWRPRRSWRNLFAGVVPAAWEWDLRPAEGLVEERRALLER